MRSVRLGIAGVGGIGGVHAQNILDGKIPRCELTAFADRSGKASGRFPSIPLFDESAGMIASGTIDAILIATPHFFHTTIGIAALDAGLHVLVEKPISVHKADCERLLAAHRNEQQIFAAMFDARTDPHYQKLRRLIQNGELGELRRINWIVTDWFRTETYYASGGWRATWSGEGGGVLLNQCPHNLDLFQWMFGMPVRVRAFCSIGRYHDIEVEDDVTAYFEFANGCTAVFITSTGETPGTNRLEVTGDRGKILVEDGALHFTRNEVPMVEWSRTATGRFDRPGTWDVRIACDGHGGHHVEMLTNFVDAILDGKPIIAPAGEGIRSVELANAMLLSSFQQKTLDLPLDSAAYEAFLQERIASSKPKTRVVATQVDDMAKSFR